MNWIRTESSVVLQEGAAATPQTGAKRSGKGRQKLHWPWSQSKRQKASYSWPNIQCDALIKSITAFFFLFRSSLKVNRKWNCFCFNLSLQVNGKGMLLREERYRQQPGRYKGTNSSPHTIYHTFKLVSKKVWAVLFLAKTYYHDVKVSLTDC